MIETERLRIDEVMEDEIPLVVKLENTPGIKEYISSNIVEEHRKNMLEKNMQLLLFRTKDNSAIAGYAFIVLDFSSEIFELKDLQ